MKKIVALLLCLAMVFSLCACSLDELPQDSAGFLTMLMQALKNIVSKINLNPTAAVPVGVVPRG